MSRPRQHIPSVEEIRARMNLQDAGVDVGGITAATHGAVVNERDTLRSRVAELQGQLDRARVSPTAMKLTFDAICERHGVEPADELIRIATARDEEGRHILPAKERASIWADLLQYRMPKLRATEVSGKIDHSLTIVVQRFGSGEKLSEKRIDMAAGQVIDVTPDTLTSGGESGN